MACARPTDHPSEEPEAPIHTERNSYRFSAGEFGPELTIVARFMAGTDGPVYIVNCNGAFSWRLQKLVDDAWVDAWAASLDACLSSPIIVPAGGSHTSTHLIRPRAGAVLNPSGSQDEVGTGTYRIVWDGVLRSFDPGHRPFGKEVPLDQRVSNPFSVAAREQQP